MPRGASYIILKDETEIKETLQSLQDSCMKYVDHSRGPRTHILSPDIFAAAAAAAAALNTPNTVTTS